ncbi:MAG: DNA-formamidopyrimidine glycosylase family protein [Verrucomicrobiota bacterium]
MPELAEVAYFLKQWAPGLNRRVSRVRLHAGKRIFRGVDTRELETALSGATFKSAQSHGKQILYGFSGGNWLGVHLGMTGKLFNEPTPYAPDKHDHLVLEQQGRVLVFCDPRLFGRIRFDRGKKPPAWWVAQPPSLLSDAFTLEEMRAFLLRRKRAPIKAVLLMQERFPGIGNWMADEILWRAGIHPAAEAGSLSKPRSKRLYEAVREVCRDAMEVIGTDWNDPPDSWLFNHRWVDGGRCPKTNKPLVRDQIGGRTTCFSPSRQRL